MPGVLLFLAAILLLAVRIGLEHVQAHNLFPPRPGRMLFRKFLGQSRSSRDPNWLFADVSITEGGLVVRRLPRMVHFNPVEHSFSLDFENIERVSSSPEGTRIDLTNGEWLEVEAGQKFASVLGAEVRQTEPDPDRPVSEVPDVWTRYERSKTRTLPVFVLACIGVAVVALLIWVKIRFYPNPVIPSAGP